MTLENRSEGRSVRTVSEYLRRISIVRSRLDGGQNGSDVLAFRGQEKESWELQSSAERRLDMSPSGPEGVTNEAFIKYHEDIILACRRNRFDRRDSEELHALELLVELQHYRAATCLIDFTRNALVALWFACENPEKDGKVFVVNTADDEQFLEATPDDIRGHSITEILKFETRGNHSKRPEGPENQESTELVEGEPQFWRWTPAGLNERILAQHSLFIFGPLSSGKPNTEEIIIGSSKKAEIREELKDVHDIHEETLFPDFVGFAYTHRHNSLFGPSAIEYYRLGVKAGQRGEYSQAVQHFTNLIQLNSEEARSYRVRGGAYDRLREFGSAIRDYSKAIELDLADPRSYRLRGGAFMRLREFQSAIQDYSKVIDLNPDDPRSYRLRGGAFMRLREFQSAIQDYSNAIDLDPEDPRSYHMRGRTFERLEDIDSAVQDYSRAVNLSPEDPQPYLWRGRAYARRNDFDSAIQDYSKAIELDPDEESNHFYRGGIYQKQGNFDSAVQDFTKELELDPQDTETLEARAKAYIQLGESDLAVKDLNGAIELEPDSDSSYGHRAVAQLCLERWDQSEADFAIAKIMGLGVPSFFLTEYGALADFTTTMNIHLPESIVAILDG